jgi:hypothetical protein
VATQLFGISCPSVALCVAVDGNGYIASSSDPTNPASWSMYHVDGTTAIDAISCPTESLCVAVDGAGHALTSTDPNSGNWNVVTIDPDANGLTAVSCPSASLCVVTEAGVDAGDIVTSTNPTGDASAWNIADIDGSTALRSVSCPTTDSCVAGDDTGDILSSTDPTGGVAAWATKNVDGTNSISSISCPASIVCIAVDSEGNVLTGSLPPFATTGSAGSIARNAATLNGTVNPNGIDVTDCHFSYGVGSPSGANVPCSSAPGSGTSAVPVSASLSGLASGTTYQFRLVATTAGGTNFGAVESFTTSSGTPPTPTYTLTVSEAGVGSGSVTSSPAGIDCGATCSHAYLKGTVVTLTTQAGTGSVFDGWSGACTGLTACTVTMNTDEAVSALFSVPPKPPPSGCVVPKVKGKTLAAAKRAIKSRHCSVGRIKRVSSRTVAKGRVISQKPKPRSRLRRGAKVNLVVSKGRSS